MRLDTETLCAALLHDTVEDTSASLEEVRELFGDEVAALVDGVTKLTGITFHSRDEAQAENYRKMMVAMASDIRVILIKLADRLHNMRTIDAMPKQKQIEKAKETLEIYAPIAHRLGIHAIKWELEDLAFATLHPRKYQEIKGLVNQQREEREDYVKNAGDELSRELEALGINAHISGRAKHFYSIYSKMTKKGREFNEIYDLTAMRVIVDSVKDCYGAVGVIHSLWKPLPGRFKDFVAMPKFNMYQSLHTTVIGPEGRPLEIQIRTRDMHDMAEFGVAAHWMYKQDPAKKAARRPRATRSSSGCGRCSTGSRSSTTPRSSWRPCASTCSTRRSSSSRPRARSSRWPRAPRRWTSPTRSTPRSATAASARRSTARSSRCNYELQSGDIVEILTSKRERGPSRDWLALVKTTRARNKIKQFFKAESREDTEHTGRELLQEHLKKQGLPAAEDRQLAAAGRRHPRDGLPQGRRLLHRAGRREDLAQGRRQQGHAAPQAGRGGRGRDRSRRGAGQHPPRAPPADRQGRLLRHPRRRRRGRPRAPGQVLPARCRATRSSATSRSGAASRSTATTAPTRWRCARTPSASCASTGRATTRRRSGSSCRSTPGTATACSRTSRARSPRPGFNIVEARCIVSSPMVQNRFVVEVPDTQGLKQAVTRLRNIEGVFDAYRITPGSN